MTPSLGVIPVRVKNDQKDIFRLTLPPGKTITFVAELASDKPTRVYLWKPLSFTQKARDVQLFNGIMLGIVGLLGIFLTAVFAANHKVIFPSAALLTWCVLAYLCVEFGFWHKLFQLHVEDNAMYRAASESAVASALVIFLFTFLRLNVWHGFVRMFFALWIAAQLGLVFAAVLDPKLASTFARLSFVAIGALGGLLALFLAARGQDRALSLIPTWLLFGVWLFGMAMAITGRLSGDVTVSALIAGLVLFVLLIGFTVTQFAFRSTEPTYGAAPNQLQLRSLAIDGSGSAVWEWNTRRDEVKVSPVVEALLGLREGELSNKVDNFVKHLHPSDRERFRLSLFSAKESTSEFISVDFRMRHVDNSYRWFELEAARVPGADRKSLRCVGLLRDITETRRAQERLMHDAVHDSLTGLPNRELFLDRLGVAMSRTATERQIRPTIFFVDIDKFKSINSSFGLIVGDSLLLSVARRLGRHVHGQDTLARVGGDQFAILLMNERPVAELSRLADEIRHALRAPIAIAGQEIILTISMGIALFDGQQADDIDLLREAEIAMYRAKRAGTDRIEVFKPDMRADKDERITIESNLRRAITNNQLKLFYQPIIHLPTEELAGFEALVRWQHPKHGLLDPDHFIPVAEETDLIVMLGSFALTTAASAAAKWQKELPRADDPLFVSVNVSSRQLFRQELIQELRNIIGQAIVPRGSLRLEVTETLVMENPEQAMRMLELLKEAGAKLSLDDFGTGYSSLAYLQRFPFDTIKIDKALVQGSGEDGPEAIIVRSIVALAHELDKKVVAEGVEVAEDVGFLRSIGCAYAQGFYYGEAMSEREVIQLLRMIRKSERRKVGGGLFKSKAKKKLLKSSAGSTGERAGDAAVALPQQAAKSESSATSNARPEAPPPNSVSGKTSNAGTKTAGQPANGLSRQPIAPSVVAKSSGRPARSSGNGTMPAGVSPTTPSAEVSRASKHKTSNSAPENSILAAQTYAAESAKRPTPMRDTKTGNAPARRAATEPQQVAASRLPKNPPPVVAAAPLPAGNLPMPQVQPPTEARPDKAIAGASGQAKAAHSKTNRTGAQTDKKLADDFKTLPPGIAASLARLAGGPLPPNPLLEKSKDRTPAVKRGKQTNSASPNARQASSSQQAKAANQAPPPLPSKKKTG